MVAHTLFAPSDGHRFQFTDGLFDESTKDAISATSSYDNAQENKDQEESSRSHISDALLSCIACGHEAVLRSEHGQVRGAYRHYRLIPNMAADHPSLGITTDRPILGTRRSGWCRLQQRWPRAALGISG